MESQLQYVSPLERAAARAPTYRMMSRRALHVLAISEMKIALGGASESVFISKRALDTALNMAEEVVRRIGRLAAVRALRHHHTTLEIRDVRAALNALDIDESWLEAETRGANGESVSLVRVGMMARMMHHEFAYAHRDLEKRERAKVRESVGRSMSKLMNAFVVLLFRFAARFVASVHHRRLVGHKDVVRAYKEVLEAASAR